MQTAVINYTFNTKAETLYPYLLDFEKFGKLHPYMVKTEKLEENYYLIHEKLLLYGFIPMRPSYTVRVHEVEKGKTILYTSHVKKGVDLKLNFEFSEGENDQTIIKETMEVKANKLIGMVFINLVKKAHKKLFESLANAEKIKIS